MKHTTARITAVLLTLAMVIGMLTVLPFTASAADTTENATGTTALPTGAVAYDGTPVAPAGTGTAEDPYLIANAANFVYFRDTLAAAATADTYAELTADIYLNSADAPTSNALSSTLPDFYGVLDGKGYTVYNMYYSGNQHIALFNYIYGTIKNLNFDGVNFKTTAGYKVVATIAFKQVSGLIENVHVYNAKFAHTKGAAYVGGLVADMGNKTGDSVAIDRCSVSGTFTATGTNAGNMGGLVASLESAAKECIAEIKNSVSNVDLISSHCHMGGILGNTQNADTNSGFTITGCVNNGTVTTTNGDGGGIIGRIAKPRGGNDRYIIDNCVNNGKINANVAGGIFGTQTEKWSCRPFVRDCVNYGEVIGNTNAGGIAGKIDYFGLRVTNTANLANVTATNGAAGALIGQYQSVNNPVVAENYISVGTITGKTAAGAIVGVVNYGGDLSSASISLNNVYIKGEIIATEGTQAIFSAGTGKADDTAFPSVSAVNCGFAVTVEGTVYSRIDANGVGYNGYNDGTEDVEDAYPAVDKIAFSNNTISNKLNTFVTTNNSTEGATPLTPWAQGAKAPVLVTSLGLSGATMSLGGNIALNMKLDASTVADLENVSVSFVNAATEEGVEAELINGYYTVSYEDVRAARLAEDLKLYVVVTVDGTPYESSNVLNYSPAQYLVNIATDYAEREDVVDLATKMLYYGAVAEATADSETLEETDVAALVGAGIATMLPNFSEVTGYAPDVTNKAALNNIADTGAGLLGSGLELTFTMKDDSYTALTVTDAEGNEATVTKSGNVFTVTGIPAAVIAGRLTLTFAGATTTTIPFAVGDFLEARRGNADETALAEATIMYMMAARAYTLAN